MEEQRQAFFVLKDVTDRKGSHIAMLAREGEKGYHQTSYRWGEDYLLAQQKADEMNEEWFGLSREEATKIVLGTMPMRGRKHGNTK